MSSRSYLFLPMLVYGALNVRLYEGRNRFLKNSWRNLKNLDKCQIVYMREMSSARYTDPNALLLHARSIFRHRNGWCVCIQGCSVESRWWREPGHRFLRPISESAVTTLCYMCLVLSSFIPYYSSRNRRPLKHLSSGSQFWEAPFSWGHVVPAKKLVLTLQ